MPVIAAMAIGASVGAASSALTYLPVVSEPAAAPSLEASGPQSPWVVRFETSRHDAKRQEKAQADEGAALTETVGDFYDAWLLNVDELPAVVASRFAPDAGRAIAETSAGWPSDVTQVSITKRKARIGIQVGQGRRAIAVVRVKASGLSGGNAISLRQKSTMWLEKKAGVWRVIGFEINQKPMN